MKWTGLNEIREKYLAFFEGKGHLRIKSYSLVPINDKSLLLINSGMAPMKKFFLGQETPPSQRVTSCQKCIRTPDIENVGKTARHGTYFEMLGNFSFQDYFKIEATKWAWEFCTEVMELPAEKIWISIYQDDDQAHDIWTKEVGIPAEKIVRMGKADNFWEHGSGPCGPCSELYFDRGEDKGCGSPDCKVGCECDRYIEFWNLVFSQFDSDGKGVYTPLDKPNIDTGMGLERLACIMQDVDNLFEVDTMQNIMKHIGKIANVEYKKDEKQDVSLRVITDHIRSTTFMMCDGVVPANEGRGYVLKRLLRRAARHGKLLGINRAFLYEVVDTVVKENATAYPELVEQQSYIKKLVQVEEENFAKTIDKGMELLQQILSQYEQQKVLSGEEAFKLYDTYGFPIDLTKEILEEKGIEIDMDGFNKCMEVQRTTAREARSDNSAFGDADAVIYSNTSTHFVGYDSLQVEAEIKVIAIEGQSVMMAQNDDQPTDTEEDKFIISVATDSTPFYAQGGGQVADTGKMVCGDFVFNVTDVKKVGKAYVHIGSLESGTVTVGDKATLTVEQSTRRKVMANHTAAHLLQASLIRTLGKHVHQAGQLVDDKRVRFDFNHFEAVSKEDISKIEQEINDVIQQAIEVQRYETDINSAREKGAMALFGEKYGDVVRVCEIGDFSIELCGGTHVDNTSKIGLFKILSESSAAAGVRRIEAVTGMAVLELLNDYQKQIENASSELKLANPSELVNRCSAVMNEIKEKSQEIDSLTQKLSDSHIEGLFENPIEINGVYCISAMFSGTKPDALRKIGDKVREKAPNAVALVVGTTGDKATMLCVCGENAISKGANAGKIVQKAASITGSKGGGKADSAMAGVGDKHKIDEALDALTDIIKELLV